MATEHKPSDVSWHDYISASPFTEFARSDDYKRCRELSSCLSAVCSFRFGDLRTKNVAKSIIKEPTNQFAIRNGHHPFCFRFQCLTTGRVSKYIKECDYPQFGITNHDAQTGGRYDAKAEIVDKMRPIADRLRAQLLRLWGSQRSISIDWWARYSEYLCSEEWHEKRESVLRRDGWRCVITSETERLHVHHISYKNVGQELPEDLVTVSKRVHDIIHEPSHREHVLYRDSARHYFSESWGS